MGHESTSLVGLCSGLFAASAVAVSPSLSALIPIAVQIVLMAFRTGSYVHNLAERLNPTFEKSESWTHIYPGVGSVEAAEVLEDFHLMNVRSLNLHPQLYLGRYSKVVGLFANY